MIIHKDDGDGETMCGLTINLLPEDVTRDDKNVSCSECQIGIDQANQKHADFRIWFDDDDAMNQFAEELNQRGIHWEIAPFSDDNI